MHCNHPDPKQQSDDVLVSCDMKQVFHRHTESTPADCIDEVACRPILRASLALIKTTGLRSEAPQDQVGEAFE